MTVPFDALSAVKRAYPDWIGTKKSNGTLHSITAFIGERFLKERLRAIREAQLSTSIVLTRPNFPNTEVNVLIDHYVLCSTSRLPAKEMSRLWSNYRWDPKTNTFSSSFVRKVAIVENCPKELRACYLAYPTVIGLGRKYWSIFELVNGAKTQWVERGHNDSSRRISGKSVDWEIQIHLMDELHSAPEAAKQFRGFLNALFSN